MDDQNNGRELPWQKFYGTNLGYIVEKYEQYANNPYSIEESLRELFDQWGPPPLSLGEGMSAEYSSVSPRLTDQISLLKKAVETEKLVQNIRTYGHLAAKINTFSEKEDVRIALLDPDEYQLSEHDLEAISAEYIWPDAPRHVRTAKDAVRYLRGVYTDTLAFQFSHVYNVEERNWLYRMVESGEVIRRPSTEQRVALLKRLTEVEGFERFLHRTFVGQKRFSIEGLDMLVPMLDELIRQGVDGGASNILIGMAHRGRLNVLAHVLGKPYKTIFSEFLQTPNKELVPSEGSMGINYGWTGDVKYHPGADRQIEKTDAIRARITLANNPSHLEFVNPVVVGFTRAAQEQRQSAGLPKQDVTRAFAVLIHGDAAFPGEGIVAETFNLSRLRGYHTGGTIHIIANNQLGFTTDSGDSRSTIYASDLAKGFEIPIVHVNADDPEACLQAARLAIEYRKRFHKDFLIDLIGYRRLGHNEMDDPAVTQPQLYAKVGTHPGVRRQYDQRLQSEGLITSAQVEEMEKMVQDRLHREYEELKKQLETGRESDQDGMVHAAERPLPPDEVVYGLPDVHTAVSLDVLREINQHLLKWPEGFTINPKLERVLKRRAEALEEGGKVDWALAETLAFASILADGTPIRITGQDTERGTFAQRHLILHDSKTGERFAPLQVLPQARASFAIYNSPLSEASVLGFEYGYDVFAQNTLVLWEAQYGDFVNAAQVMIDTFLAAGRAKWGQKSNLVLLLPHGYEGQGPEHSNARPERFLQLAAENNWIVANMSSAAQYFHILRRQAAIVGKHEARPLIIMTPKSLLRNQRVASPGSALSEGTFAAVIEQSKPKEQADQAERLVLCSGKIAIDLEEELESRRNRGALPYGLHLMRVEQLYPFPEEEIKTVVGRCKRLREIVWVQEEPRNMGAWTYLEPRLRNIAPEQVAVRYIGRPRRSSPAEGQPDLHKIEQNRILQEALHPIGSKLPNEGGDTRDRN
ncbi:2-oxoglutarate dehydrogenase E1 component [Brevibacillus humidisoli]|uniref:2-oxoglutarate dehydrogenase E1 component n=1 Tax=Brevibacillus humidisoli TaxID=2895522 RepID=UPI001E3AEC4A|nr:2-oxoglutarate dehydrogenase E1 component [Brevibacillus humidisoli]UFJ42017.1 2-oxoglutarate dehydrogenase E1 component [Brevibacillus humidisoli]